MENETQKNISTRSRHSIKFLKVLTVLSLASVITLGTFDAIDQIRSLPSEVKDRFSSEVSKLTQVSCAKADQNANSTISNLIKETAIDYNLPPLVLLALVHQESGQHLRTDRARYEPRLQKYFPCRGNETDIECKFKATSFGLTQIIYGYHKNTCDLSSYSDLLDPKTNLNCAAKILRGCLDRHKSEQKATAFRRCLGEYNGDDSGQYADEVLARLASFVVEKQLG